MINFPKLPKPINPNSFILEGENIDQKENNCSLNNTKMLFLFLMKRFFLTF
ncbi:hypothetical protein MYP_803 [Sporocytophaga myxococcoides]|uniref:Uncharacterized protein n=1 Tax=Sporocytophaga myxococcoides TaxID=153721 RepID=A0A098L9G6_9BACT|nr:hypothetical protein MYP_803 [Sporocytophaga myxococcoides]